MQYVQSNGQVTEAEYPYTSGHGSSGRCMKKGTPKVFVSRVNTVKAYSQDQLLAAISKGPVSVTVEDGSEKLVLRVSFYGVNS
mgnify:CR=1 FL=1